MTQYRYKVVPAPSKGLKAKGVKTPEARFANSVEAALNAQAGEGWEYVRSELLPSDERSGLTGSTTNWRNVLVFRRVVTGEAGKAGLVSVPPLDTLEMAEGTEQAGRDAPDPATASDTETETVVETPPGDKLALERKRVSGLVTAMHASGARQSHLSDAEGHAVDKDDAKR